MTDVPKLSVFDICPAVFPENTKQPTNRQELENRIMAETNELGKIYPFPMAVFSRAYNRLATKYETSILEILESLYLSRQLFLFRSARHGGWYVYSTTAAEQMREQMSESLTPVQQFDFQIHMLERLDLLIHNSKLRS